MKAFDVESETAPLESYELTPGQQKNAAEYGCSRAFRFRYTFNLPLYVRQAIERAGYKAHLIGRTTYKHTTWGLSLI